MQGDRETLPCLLWRKATGDKGTVLLSADPSVFAFLLPVCYPFDIWIDDNTGFSDLQFSIRGKTPFPGCRFIRNRFPGNSISFTDSNTLPPAVFFREQFHPYSPGIQNSTGSLFSHIEQPAGIFTGCQFPYINRYPAWIVMINRDRFFSIITKLISSHNTNTFSGFCFILSYISEKKKWPSGSPESLHFQIILRQRGGSFVLRASICPGALSVCC